MSEQMLTGALVMAAVIFLAIVVAVWLRGHLERRQGKGRHRDGTIILQEPAPGSFTAKVLNAERAASNYREAVLTGNLDAVMAARQAITKAHAPLILALAQREQTARAVRELYASESGDVTVSSSATGGEPHGEDHRPKHR